MRPRDLVYDELLRFQADMSFDVEQSLFVPFEPWHAARHVLDFGCGNAYYAQRLAERNPEKHFVCLESDKAMAARARAGTYTHNIEVVCGSYSDLPTDAVFDFVIARHVLSYLPDRHALMEFVCRQTSASAGLLAIDAEDDAFLVIPSLPLLEAGNAKFKEDVHTRGGRRDLRDALPVEWQQHRFAHVLTRSILIHSDIQGRKETMAQFMRAVAEMDHGSPLPATVAAEIDSWLQNARSYLQFGLFGSQFRKNSLL